MKFVYTFAAVAMIVPLGAAQAAETVSHQYDALGRLKQTTKSGGPATGQQTTLVFDPAGNRTNSTIGGVGGVPAPPPPSPPPPPPPNQPPVANADSMSLPCWSTSTKNVVANDTDPEGNFPLSLVSVDPSGDVFASIANSTTITIQAQGTRGATTVDYVIQDSLGATANGTLAVTVNGNVSLCGS